MNSRITAIASATMWAVSVHAAVLFGWVAGAACLLACVLLGIISVWLADGEREHRKMTEEWARMARGEVVL